MPQRGDLIDLASMKLAAGEGRRLELEVRFEPFVFGDESYAVEPARAPVTLDVAKMVGGGYSLRLRGDVALSGACMRCLQAATPRFDFDAREVDRPGGGEEMSSPYVFEQRLDLTAWARDALALALPAKIVCRDDCAGLCAICGADLNDAGPEHGHERAPDPRWAKLRELKLE